MKASGSSADDIGASGTCTSEQEAVATAIRTNYVSHLNKWLGSIDIVALYNRILMDDYSSKEVAAKDDELLVEYLRLMSHKVEIYKPVEECALVKLMSYIGAITCPDKPALRLVKLTALVLACSLQFPKKAVDHSSTMYS